MESRIRRLLLVRPKRIVDIACRDVCRQGAVVANPIELAEVEAAFDQRFAGSGEMLPSERVKEVATANVRKPAIDRGRRGGVILVGIGIRDGSTGGDIDAVVGSSHGAWHSRLAPSSGRSTPARERAEVLQGILRGRDLRRASC